MNDLNKVIQPDTAFIAGISSFISKLFNFRGDIATASMFSNIAGKAKIEGQAKNL